MWPIKAKRIKYIAQHAQHSADSMFNLKGFDAKQLLSPRNATKIYHVVSKIITGMHFWILKRHLKLLTKL